MYSQIDFNNFATFVSLSLSLAVRRECDKLIGDLSAAVFVFTDKWLELINTKQGINLQNHCWPSGALH